MWGPGDNGVDELLAQYDRDAKPWYAAFDAQGDLVSLLHQPTGTSPAEVAGQWTYSPYGQVLTYEQIHDHPLVNDANQWTLLGRGSRRRGRRSTQCRLRAHQSCVQAERCHEHAEQDPVVGNAVGRFRWTCPMG
ncbi:MAG TPA: hypothetical protein VF777_05105 [Phycisphaerales bacterium]